MTESGAVAEQGPDPAGPAWGRIEALFDEAFERPAAAREAWLRQAGADPAEIAEVLALLAAADRPGILDEPIGLGGPDDDGAAIRDRIAGPLADRYRIDRVLGHGGMATVFLAEERKHARSVVLKVLRPEVVRWVGAQRFHAEIRILARLSHPNIVSLIDSGDAGGLLYYVMPYQGGMTLRQRLAAGPVPLAEAVDILTDIARALAHAHERGLVHRDLKPDNVLVADGHGYLMDFGVAKLVTGPGVTTETLDGVAVGTLAYMAPEQAAGQRVDSRADVFAWGLVAREALQGKTDQLRPDVPAPLAALIAATVDVHPEERPADGAALVARLEALGGLRPEPRRRRGLALAVLTVVALAAAVTVWLVANTSPRLESVPAPVVVIPLRNETGDSSLAVWGRLAGDWLTQGLQETGRVAVVPWPVALQGAAAAAAGGATPTVKQIAAETGAGTVVTGSFYLVGDRIRFQAEFTDPASGVSLAAVPAVEVLRDSLHRGIQQLRGRVMGVLAIRTDQRLSTAIGAGDRPPTYEAYRLFERGIDGYNRQDYQAASADLIEAWRRDTVFIPALVYASLALWNTGDRARADSLVRQIRARPASLGSYHELQVRYLELRLAGHGAEALAPIREAAARAPGGRAGYNLALAALAVGRPGEALATLEQVDPERGMMRGWAPYWFALSHALHLEGRTAEELAASRQIRIRHPDSRAGWVHLVRAYATLADTAAIDSLLGEAGALPPDTYWSQGAMMVTAGEELAAHGHGGSSRRYLELAIRWLANQLARDPHHRAHRYWMGSAQYDLGRFEDAEPYFESLVHDFPDDLLFRTLHALAAARQGDSATAARRLGPEPPYQRGEYLSAQARLAAVAGDGEQAVALWSEAMNAGVGSVAWIHAAARRDLEPLLDDPRFRRLGILPAR